VKRTLTYSTVRSGLFSILRTDDAEESVLNVSPDTFGFGETQAMKVVSVVPPSLWIPERVSAATTAPD
jgi:hypothetical protein